MKFLLPLPSDESVIGSASGRVLQPGEGGVYAVWAPLENEELRLGPFLKIRGARAGEHISRLKMTFAEFHLLIDCSCLGNREFTGSGYRKIRNGLEYLRGSGVDSVIVSSPYILEIAVRALPGIKAGVAREAFVDSPRRALYWQKMGADFIVLPETVMSRDFRTLAAVRSNVSCSLFMPANSACLGACPFSTNPDGGAACDFSCRELLRGHPEYAFTRGCWIRPGDSGIYASLGIDGLWIFPAHKNGASLPEIAAAYRGNTYNGDLRRLLPDENYGGIKLENKLLDGFLKDLPCADGDMACGGCGYCASWLRKTGEIC